MKFTKKQRADQFKALVGSFADTADLMVWLDCMLSYSVRFMDFICANHAPKDVPKEVAVGVGMLSQAVVTMINVYRSQKQGVLVEDSAFINMEGLDIDTKIRLLTRNLIDYCKEKGIKYD